MQLAFPPPSSLFKSQTLLIMLALRALRLAVRSQATITTSLLPLAHTASTQRRLSSSTSSAPIPLSALHKALLGLGSAAASLHNPARGDMIALLSELSSEPLLQRLRHDMLASPEGRQLLLERPEINTKTVDMDRLRAMEERSFGRAYTQWMEWCRVGPDTRAPVSRAACRRTCGR